MRTTMNHNRRLRGSLPAICIVIIAFLVLPATVAADEFVGGLPLTTVKTETVTGDLWFDAAPAPNWGSYDVTKTFTLPAAAVAEPGRITWARLYISGYVGHMQNDYPISFTNSFDGDGVSGYEQVWFEPNHAPFAFVGQGGCNDNSALGGGSCDPYKMLNDHETRVTSDYFMWYDVTNMISSQTVNVNVNTVTPGQTDGRIKVITLVVAYNDPASTTQTTYWVNEGHDACSYYTENNMGEVAVGSTTFGTSGVTGISSATLTVDYMASHNGLYGFPTKTNIQDAGVPSITFTNQPLASGYDVQGPYSGLMHWDVTSLVTGSGNAKLGYSRDVSQSGLSAFYKIPLAFLVVKKPLSVPAPVAAFSAAPVSGTAPLTVLFTDESTNSPTSRVWDFGDGNTSWSTAETTFAHTYESTGTYDVTLAVSNAGGSDDEAKEDFIAATSPPPVPVAAFSADPVSGTVPLTVLFTDGSTSSAGGSGERITNGGFETGDLTGWTKSGYDWDASTDQHYHGAGSVVSGRGGGGALSQQVDLTGVDALTFYLKGHTEATLTVKIDSAVVLTQAPETYYGPWTQYTIGTSAYTGTHTVSFSTNVDGEGQEIFLDDISATGSSGITSRVWNFGDGNATWSTAETTFTHTYASAGTYDVTLTVTDANGSDDEIKDDYITATMQSQPDLRVKMIVPNAASIAAGKVFALEPNQVTIKIQNEGTSPSGATTARLVSGDGFSGSAEVPALEAGADVLVVVTDSTVRPSAGADVTYTATADPDNLIAESNETDNALTSMAYTTCYNGYKGKRYWDGGSDVTTRHTFDLNGSILYSYGDSIYRSGSYGNGWLNYTVNWQASDLPVPAGATVRAAYLYVPYTWDNEHIAPDHTFIDFNGERVSRSDWYSDKINFGSYGEYGYGLMTYDVTSLFTKNALNSAVFTRENPNYSDPELAARYTKLSMYEFYLVVVYEDPAESRKQVFLNEEFDLLGASSEYSTTPEEATAYVPFTGMTIDTGEMESAMLVTFVPSGDSYEGNLLYNGNVIASNVWAWGGSETIPEWEHQIAVDVRDVKAYIQPAANTFGIQSTDSGGTPCMIAAQQFLVIDYGGAPVAAPVAAFTGTPVSGNVPLTVLFTDTSSGSPTGRVWDFGDGNSTWTTTETTFAHTYIATGTYDVTLTVSNAGGSDSEAKDDYITVTDEVITIPGQANPPTDPDHDGKYEDLSGSSGTDFPDVQLYFQYMDWIAANEPVAPFDYSNSGTIDFPDIQILFAKV